MSNNSTAYKALTIAGGIAGTALIIWPLAVWLEVRSLERPKYKRLLTLGSQTKAFYDRSLAISIREYSPYLVAEVTVEGEDLKDASSKGFKQVAGYIFGGNVKSGKIDMTAPVQTQYDGHEKEESNEKIAMTAPVATEMTGGRYKIAFMMPSKYRSKEDLPKPKNAAIQFKEIPAHVLAAISWRGYPTPSEEVIKAKEDALKEALADAGIELADKPDTKLYQYWPPFAPTPIKDYDVLLPIKRQTVPLNNTNGKHA